MSEREFCQNCSYDLTGEKIWDHFYKKYGCEARADEVAEMYGATRDKGHFGKKIGVYDVTQDRVVVYRCPSCNFSWPIGLTY